MFTISLNNYSNDISACLYLDIEVIHQQNPQLFHLQFTAIIDLKLDGDFCMKDFFCSPAKKFTVLSNELFSEQELNDLQRNYFTGYPQNDDRQEMAILKKELDDYFNVIIENHEVKIQINAPKSNQINI